MTMDINKAEEQLTEVIESGEIDSEDFEAIKVVLEKERNLRTSYAKLSLDWDEVLTAAEQVAESFKPIGPDPSAAIYLAVAGIEAEKRIKALQEIVKKYVLPKEKTDGKAV